jgi:hypothetical protein
VCAACALAAASAVTGARTWLQTHHMGWLTPQRLRAITIALIVIGCCVSTFGLSGSTPR